MSPADARAWREQWHTYHYRNELARYEYEKQLALRGTYAKPYKPCGPYPELALQVLYAFAFRGRTRLSSMPARRA